MRKVLDTANNGQALNEVVEYTDLTQDEKAILHIPSGTTIEDYANFQVRHNKKGELLGVKAHDFSEAKSQELNEHMDDVTILDIYVAFGPSETPISLRDRFAAIDKLKRHNVFNKAKVAFSNNLF